MSGDTGTIRIGISGWLYRGWRGVFYPKGLRQKDELRHASGIFDSVEINGTFYSLQRPEAFERWRDTTPDDFVFAVKGGRFITHMKKLRDVETAVANFFAAGVLALHAKLGPILWQLPASFAYDEERLDRFLSLLPRDSEAAAELARRHDHRVAGRSFTMSHRHHTLRHAIEIRHPSFLDAGFIRLLRRQNVALVFADTVDWPYAEDVTADFVYIRLHGGEELYTSGYEDAALDWWAARIESWAAGRAPNDAKLVDPDTVPCRQGRDVYVYFDNDAKVRAPLDAQALRRRLPPDKGTAHEHEPAYHDHAAD
jgi:uncharacterized protein YecE (DUF72 family)